MSQNSSFLIKQQSEYERVLELSIQVEELELLALKMQEDVNNYLVCHKVDIWALGCLISYLFTGIVPWTNKCNNNIMKIQNALIKKIAFPIPDKWFLIDDLTKSRLIKILELCLKTNYKERINSKGLKKLILALFFDKDFDSTLLEMKNIESEYFR